MIEGMPVDTRDSMILPTTEPVSEHCFVIQPFDERGPFDKRYAEVLEPAISRAGLSPYRVDHDHKTKVVIEQIETQIRASRVCLADISEDNPNVWYELGYARASNKEVVLICQKNRSSFPFDVRHRSIILYSTDSTACFEDMGNKITQRLIAYLETSEQMRDLAVTPLVAPMDGLQNHEVALLLALSQGLATSEHGLTMDGLDKAMERAGFTKHACVLATHELISRKIVERRDEEDYDSNKYVVYRPTENGIQWLSRNLDRVPLTRRTQSESLFTNDFPF
ncbi:MAG: hypothetical protein FLDDKLPJ_01246 [Phycisphaerae bacterium]|nr:hypothetical protein [Phycisphaerae bacterium]